MSQLTPEQLEANKDRAFRGRRALEAYERCEGADSDAALQDLLADLIHLAAEDGGDVEQTFRMATVNYEAEAHGED